MPYNPQNITAPLEVIDFDTGIDVDVDVDVASAREVESQINNPFFVSEIDLASYCRDSLLREMHALTPLERFKSYRCRREAVFVDAIFADTLFANAIFADADSVPPQQTRPQTRLQTLSETLSQTSRSHTLPQRRGRSRVGKRKGRKSSVRAQSGSVREISTSNQTTLNVTYPSF